MSVPVVVLNRDRGLDELCLQCTANGVQKRLQVGLERDPVLDSLALVDHQSWSNPGGAPPGRKHRTRPPRKRRKLAESFKPEDVSLFATPVDGSIRMLPGASDLNDNEISPTSNCKRLQTLTVAKQDDRLEAATEDRNGQVVTDIRDQDGCEPLPLSKQPSCSSNTSKEDFMALLCLTPAHVAARFRKCTSHRTSKYLHIRSRNLWNKICREKGYEHYVQDIETAKRHSYVVLERNELIDSLALQSIPQSIHLKRLAKSDNLRRRLCKRKTQSLNVVLARDPGLDRLAMLNSVTVCSSSSSPEMNYEGDPRGPVIESMVSHCADSKINHPACKRLSVKVNRDPSLDMLAQQVSSFRCGSLSSNCPRVHSKTNIINHVVDKPGLKRLSIGIKRDLSIDQLALQNCDTSISGSGSDCNSTTVANRQPASEPSSDSSISTVTRDGLGTRLKQGYKAKLRVLPNLSAESGSKTADSRIGVIKLRRLVPGGWSVVHPGLESCGSQHSTQESADSENATAEFARNPYASSQAPLCTSNSSRSEYDFGREIRSNANQSRLSNVRRHQNPVFRCSVRQRFRGVVYSCSKPSSRAKSMPIEESSREHRNENENPQKPVIPPVKHVAILKPRRSKQSDAGVLQNSPNGTVSASETDHGRDQISSMQPSISSFLSVKKTDKMT